MPRVRRDAIAPFSVPIKNLKRLLTYLKPEVYEALQKLAQDEDRSMSNQAARIIADWLQQKGKIPTSHNEYD